MRRSTIEKKALSLLLQQGIKRIPIGVKTVARNLGVDVMEADLPTGTSGLLEKNPQGRSMILVNKEHALVRKRFTVAHELGHLVLEDRSGLYVDKKIYFRNSKSEEATDKAEIMANTFAAELLMPTPYLKEELMKYLSLGRIDAGVDVVGELATTFKVSTTAMSIKLNRLGLSY